MNTFTLIQAKLELSLINLIVLFPDKHKAKTEHTKNL